jgi:hypothetical protein
MKSAIIEEISKVINEDVFPKLKTKSLNVFLVGSGHGDPNSIRESVRKELIARKYYNWLDVYYPEELFEELLGKGGKFDLLSLENLLAESVHAVVIILESPGAIAELGAFANHKDLCNRLVVIVDSKYKKSKSFIALGPIRYLKKKTNSEIIPHNLRNPDIKKLGEDIKNKVRKIAQSARVDANIANPIMAQHFLLGVIYVMEPVEKEILNGVIKSIQKQSFENIETILSCSLNILLHNDEVVKKDRKYLLTEKGLKRLQNKMKLEHEGQKIEHYLDTLRVKFLNHTLRRQKST